MSTSKYPPEKYDGKSKLKVLRVIRSKIEEEIEGQESPGEFFEDIQVYFTKSQQTWEEKLVRVKQLTMVTKRPGQSRGD